MGPVIGAMLPLALGVAISPVPIIAAVLMLMSPRAKSTALGFLFGWLGGIFTIAIVFTLLSSLLPGTEDEGSKPIRGIIHLAFGVLLLIVAIRQWRKRSVAGEEPPLPQWMQAIDAMKSMKAFGLGFLLAAVNPKNLVMTASAGLDIGSASLGFGAGSVVIIIFTLLAGVTVLTPVVGFLLAADRLREPLRKLQAWLVKENSTIMCILLLVLGVNAIGKGIGSF